VTSAAVFEAEVAAKGPLSVVTSRASLPARGYEMLGGRRRTDLPGLRRTSCQFVTVSAGEPVSWAMVRMTKSVAIRPRVDGRRAIGLLFMTNTARSDLASGFRFTRRRVATVTTSMGREVRRDRQRDSAIRRRVAAVATLLRFRRAAHVLRVIELHVETLVEARGKTPQWWIAALRVGVTDQTHRNRGRRELSAMTVSARFVTGEAWPRRVVGAFVTGGAGEGTVTLACV